MWMQVALLLVALALVVPTGTYLYRLFRGGPAPLDRFFLPVERFLYRLMGVNPEAEMGWKTYATALLASNVAMALPVFLLLLVQGILPGGRPGLSFSLALHTAVSFVTNTDLQHYAGEGTLTNLNQMALIFLMFTSAASGLAVAIAFSRGLAGRPLGNFWADVTRTITRLLVPASLLVALVLVWQGVPQTLHGSVDAQTLGGAVQRIVVGPVASLEAIKHIGTNGGGFFGANAAHPFENPTPLTNAIHIISMLWIPTSLLYAFGLFIKNRRQGWIFFTAAAVLFVVLLGSAVHFEQAGNPALHALGLPGPSLEGKEVRFSPAESALFATVTTAASTGSVNAVHDSLTPMGSLSPMMLMMLNSVFGGKGVGLLNLMAIAMIAVFLIGLMVGRTPEFLGKKLEPREVKLLAIVILLHPLLILAPSALSLVVTAGRTAISQPGLHGLSQVLYEFTTSAANNGSSFAGLATGVPYWNLMTSLVIFLGRYPSMVLMLAVAGFLAAKKPMPEGPGTLRTDTPLFGAVLVGVVIIVGALTFFPALALGPVAEHLTLLAGQP